jgi:uncharacterized protein YgiM (DUF1202 family)
VVDITSNTTITDNSANTTQNVQNITSIDTPTFTTVNETLYATQNTSVRSSYSETASIVGTLDKDQSVTRTGVSSSGWSKVTLSNGQTGYVQSSYLTATAPQTTTVQNISTTNTQNTSVYNNSNIANTTMGQYGDSDGIMMTVVIAVCVLAAIYAYKKIRDYNI